MFYKFQYTKIKNAIPDYRILNIQLNFTYLLKNQR
jgi:hypothetical protein